MDREQREFFRDRLRAARGQALEDAEGFNGIVAEVERLGRFITPELGRGLGDYEERIVAVASPSPLAQELPDKWPEFHLDVSTLLSHVRQARNDAVHEGAYARQVTAHAISLALILEDALMTESESIGHYMVRAPICAATWHPLSHVRHTLLATSFSYLPINTGTGLHPKWQLLSDVEIVKLTLGVSRNERKRRLKLTVGEAVGSDVLALSEPFTCFAGTPVAEAYRQSNGAPILVVSESSGDLLGIATAFDLL